MSYNRKDDDDCFYYHSWRNDVLIAFGTLSSFLMMMITFIITLGEIM